MFIFLGVGNSNGNDDGDFDGVVSNLQENITQCLLNIGLGIYFYNLNLL